MADAKGACALFLLTKDGGRRTKGAFEAVCRPSSLVLYVPRLSWGQP
jgi:hypothetical protein